MNRFVYLVGVYSVCVFIHKTLDVAGRKLVEQLNKEPEPSRKNKEPIGVQPEKTRKPMNKIGFAINSD